MAVSLISNNRGSAGAAASSSTIDVTTTAAIAAGSRIILVICYFGTGSVSSVSGGGLTWVVDVDGSPSSDRGLAFASAHAPSGLASGTTITVTYSIAQTDRGVQVTEWSGIKSSAYLGVSGTNTSTTTAWGTGSRAISAGSALLGASHEDNAGDHTSTPTSPSLELCDNTPSASDDFTAAYRIEASAGSYEVAGTWSTGGSANSIIYAEYLADAGGAQTVTLTARLDRTRVLNQPTLTTGAVALTLARLDRVRSLFAPTLVPGAVTVALARLDRTRQLFDPTVTPAGLNLTLTRLDRTRVLNAPTLAPGAVTVSLPGGLAHSRALFAPTVGEVVEPPATQQYIGFRDVDWGEADGP